jgi:hypothetical protein
MQLYYFNFFYGIYNIMVKYYHKQQKTHREWLKTTSNANKLKFHTLSIYDLHFYHSKFKLCDFKS